MKYAVTITCLVLTLVSCSPKKSVDTSSVKEEMARRELRQISKAEIIEAGKYLGSELAMTSSMELQNHLFSAFDTSGVSGAIQYCNKNAISIITGLQDSLNVEIGRVSRNARNESNQADSLETVILEAYRYNLENALSIDEQITEIEDELFLYTKPIQITSHLCLNCHGTVGKKLTDENYNVIKELYPDDKAIGYKIGDLRGMWSIIMPTKTIVENM